MKRKTFSVLLALVLALSLCLVTAVPVNAASITTVTPTGIMVGDAYTDLTGPVIAEDAFGEFGVGTIILTAPDGFAFDTGSDVTATVTGNSIQLKLGPGPGAATQDVTPTADTITIDVFSVSVTNPSTITYTGIGIKDSDDTSGSTGDLEFSGGAGVTGSAGTLTSIPDVIDHFALVTEGTGPYVAGTAFNVTITAVDQFDNPLGADYVTDEPYTWESNASAAPDLTTPVIGTLAFTDFTAGVATKSVTLYCAEAGVTFTVTGNSTYTGTSAAITVDHEMLTDYTVVPAALTQTAGTPFNVVITAVDQYENPLGSDYSTDAPYTWESNASAAPDLTTPVIGTLAPFTDGVGTTPVTLYCAEAGVTFTVTDASTMTGTSAGIDVNPAAVDTLTIVQEPTDAVAVVAIAPPVTVEAVDQYENVIEGQNIAASLIAGSGVLSGTTPRTTDGSGIATFNDLSINLVGAGKQLQFTADAVTVDSVLFAITVGAVDALTIEFGPSDAFAGVAIAPPIQVKAVDAESNPIATQDITVTLLAGDRTLSGTLTQATDSSGIATFDDLSINLIGVDKQLRFTADAVTVDSAVFVITHGEAVGFTFADIGTQDAGVAFAITINAVDAYGNTDTDYVGTATLSDLTGTIGPGDTGTFIDGVGYVTILLLYTDNTITATDAAITGTSDPFDVSPYPVYNTTTGEGYLTIQEAVTDAAPDEVITVGPGTYVGDITIGANLTIVSSGGAEVTKLTGTGLNPVVTIGDYTVTLEGFEIDPGTEGIYIDDISAGNVVTIENSIIYNNTEQGIWVEGTVYGTLNILNNIIDDNDYEGILINEVDDGGSVNIKGNLVANNAYGIEFYDVDESTVTIEANTISKNYYGGIYFSGDDPVSDILVSDSTITIGGDTRAEGNIIVGNGRSMDDEGGIHVEYMEVSSLEILNNDILDNYNYGVYIKYFDEDSSLEILNNDILDNYNYGVYVSDFDEASTVDVHYNSIVDNADGLYNDSPYLIDATCNWWGDVAGPSAGTNPHVWTNGDVVTGEVDYIPWLIQSELDEGWNIWSAPITADGDSWEQMQAELVEDGVESIYYFDSATQFWGTDPDDAGPLDAYYIKMPAASRIRYCIDDEATFPGQKDMKVGWNLIGLASLRQGMGLADALTDAYWGTGQTELWGYSKVISPTLNGEDWDYIREGSLPPHPLFPTKGYWVFMVNDGTLGGFTSTPIVEVENGP